MCVFLLGTYTYVRLFLHESQNDFNFFFKELISS